MQETVLIKPPSRPGHPVERFVLPGGEAVTIRPIRPEDAGIEQDFVRHLSPGARYFRFMQVLDELSPEMLDRFIHLDYDREYALIAVVEQDGREVEIGVARYAALDADRCEFAVVVADAWQRQGIGRRLMERLMEIARDHGFRQMIGLILAENQPMLGLAERLGFRIEPVPDDLTVKRAVRDL
ncbi:GNAT family N-acetyltransferase [Rhodocaloribacter litoris]|uniref:GNAT family N-acetyltransferase n=1 Tax=Rhodocaloribacter litoris TaxID=2558931 RepID=UPI00141E02FA|nr:GNAT family N-acetyltransferase [Rhodocaloribacter litoris]QXD14938.1 GNAT family N-acetyltransferase [Rhodocaloribacter litoris]